MTRSRSLDPDHLSVDMLRILPDEALMYLTNMYNDVMERGKVPWAWKRSVFVPVYKGKEKLRHEARGYRPVALTSLSPRFET